MNLSKISTLLSYNRLCKAYWLSWFLSKFSTFPAPESLGPFPWALWKVPKAGKRVPALLIGLVMMRTIR